MQPKKILIVMMLAFAMVLSACATPAQGQTNTSDTAPQTRTLSVTGNAQISLTPDIAYVSIGVHTENKDANQAVSSNNDQATKVVDALKTMGIDAKDLLKVEPLRRHDQSNDDDCGQNDLNSREPASLGR